MKCPHGNPIASACIECSHPPDKPNVTPIDEFVKTHKKCATKDAGVSIYGDPPKWATCGVCKVSWVRGRVFNPKRPPRELCHE